ncbi:MAG: chemotaxis protein CheX [Armatimonadota bacterium]
MEKLLRLATVRAFEESAFLMPVMGAVVPDDGVLPDAAVRVAFDGPLSGALVLRVYGGLASVLAANMLGAEDVPPRRMQLDAVREMANVVCGNVLPGLSGSPKAFRIGTPQVLCEAELEWFECRPPSADVFVEFEEGSVRVKLYLDSRGGGANGRP